MTYTQIWIIEELPNKTINPTGDKPVLIFKGISPAGYLSR